MSGQHDSTGETTAIGRERRQLALVALGILALLVAAFLAPPAVPTPDDGGTGSGEGGDGGDGGATEPGGDGGQPDQPGGGGGGEPPENVERVTVERVETADGDGEWRLVTTDDLEDMVTAERCVISLLDQPTPGRTVEVAVWNGGEPVPDVAVLFNDERVGRTDELGVASGRVPYERELVVAVEPAPADDCEFVRAVNAREGTGGGVQTDDRSDDLEPAIPGPAAGVASAAIAVPDRLADGRQTGEDERNVSKTYDVPGRVNLSIRGKPYPGERVELNASIAGVPMRQATVSVDGDRTGQTDDAGRHAFAVPEERDEITVTVSRGDFEGRAVVDVLLLRMALQPRDALPVPGEPATAVTSINDRPVADAAVALDGREVGRTDSNGTVVLSLPADPGATVTAETERQTATRSLWWIYAPTVAAFGLLGILASSSVAVSYRRNGRKRAQSWAVRWLAVGFAFVAWLLFEGVGFLAAVGVLLVALLVRHRKTVAGGASSASSGLRGAIGWILSGALRLTRWLEGLLERLVAALDRLRRWLGTLPTSASALWGRFRDWLVALPGRIHRRAAPYARPRWIAALLASVALVVAAERHWDERGLVGSVALLALAALALYWRRRDSGSDDGAGSERRDRGPVAAESPTVTTDETDEASRPSVRELWRRFASWVDPGAWPHRTPGEISRAARTDGFPRKPVATLTDAFRDLEYGNAQLTADRDERVRDAFERLAAARRDEEDDR